MSSTRENHNIKQQDLRRSQRYLLLPPNGLPGMRWTSTTRT